MNDFKTLLGEAQAIKNIEISHEGEQLGFQIEKITFDKKKTILVIELDTDIPTLKKNYQLAFILSPRSYLDRIQTRILKFKDAEDGLFNEIDIISEIKNIQKEYYDEAIKFGEIVMKGELIEYKEKTETDKLIFKINTEDGIKIIQKGFFSLSVNGCLILSAIKKNEK